MQEEILNIKAIETEIEQMYKQMIQPNKLNAQTSKIGRNLLKKRIQN